MLQTQSVQADRIRSPLTNIDFVLRGRRGALFALKAGEAQLDDVDEGAVIEAPCLIWQPVGKTSKLGLSAGTRGISVRLPEVVIGRALPSGPTGGHIRQTISQQVIRTDGLAETDALDRVIRLFDEIEWELARSRSGADIAQQLLTSLLLLEIWRIAAPAQDQHLPMPRPIVSEFLALVELHLTEHWTVGDYASVLEVSRNRLNSLVNRALGQSPYAYVQSRLIGETKTLILQSDLQMSEIAYRMGFNDAAYFNRFFQRHEKLSPGRFRRQNRSKIIDLEKRRSYAAWP